MDPHLRLRSSSYVPRPSRSTEPVRPKDPRRRAGVVLAGSVMLVAVAAIVADVAKLVS